MGKADRRQFSGLRLAAQMLALSGAELLALLQRRAMVNPWLDLTHIPKTLRLGIDLTVWKQGGRWRVAVHAPRLRLRPAGPGADAPEVRWARCQAFWWVRGLWGRNRILFQVSRAMVMRQTEFLEGRVGWPRRLTLRTVAQAVGYHPSTVHRVLQGKRVQTPRGVLSLSFLLSPFREPERIREAIERAMALGARSDEAVARELRRQGLGISRRTVNKYRK